jgi:hypothetical protein
VNARGARGLRHCCADGAAEHARDDSDAVAGEHAGEALGDSILSQLLEVILDASLQVAAFLGDDVERRSADHDGVVVLGDAGIDRSREQIPAIERAHAESTPERLLFGIRRTLLRPHAYVEDRGHQMILFVASGILVVGPR